ncbi:MAG TPA: CHAT domain-containing protein, partial [Pyrinomonadaceae bacterium]|nr:CHAT domain-containing protein [Pyrinomonadaceae bacterium]
EQVAKIHQRLRDPKLDSKTEIELLDELTRVRDLRRKAQPVTASRQENYASPRPVTGPQLQAVLDSDSVVLEYAPVSQQTLLWAITKDQFKAYKLEDKEGAVLIQQYLRTLHAPLVGADEIRNHIDLGRRLYRMLVEPAAEIIRDKRHLIIVPAGLLSYLPFESLNVPGNEKSLSDVQYLINKFEITYAPSASVLVAQRTNPEANRKGKRFPLVAFGDPIYGAEEPSSVADIQETKIENLALRGLDLRRLEFSGDEVLRIAQIWDVNPNSEHINLRDKATVDRLRKMDLTKYRIVHFAAHAVLADEVKRVLQPALLLSQTGHNETTANRLQFSDILGLELNADLVVLSACDTALGQLKNGEGIVGLTRAFLYAGASSTVVSLWKVEDQSTSFLMERFYQYLKRGLSKTEALRQAKLATMRSTIDLKATGMRQDLASPFFWAPFILVGDWGPIQAN